MRRHGEAELGDGLAAVRQQPLLEFGVGPGLGDDARAILGDPLLLDGVLEVLDELERLQAERALEKKRNAS